MAFADLGRLGTLACSHADGVATVALAREEKLNAICADMHRDFRTVLDQLETDPAVRCLVLTGTGRAFCSGQDLTENLPVASDGRPDLATALDRDYNPLVARLAALQIPTIAAVNGIAAGAGANLALVCDIVLAAQGASFVEAFCRIALVPDCGGTWLLPRLVGRQRALAMMLTGEPVDAETARDWGMVWKVLPGENFRDDVQSFAARLARGPTASFAMTKRAVDAAWDNTLEEQLALERNLQAECGRADDFREGVAAFVEKRPALFRGR
ncbi:MAG: enoyl-CoA hydratase/isomerase family protein [Rhodobiaceae bacterium]|nr:enoyl-CoA hydratase/isomerase family protein [Rhodobiaceae bacterium]MCC0041087.1 enoyl-CoA hydratase/isomerase family protein [Rhodobiaceae bacterium]